MVGSCIILGPTSSVPRITLTQKHITKHSAAALRLQPPYRLRHAVLTLRRSQVSNALRHATHTLGATDQIRPPGPTTHRREHGVSAAHPVRVIAVRRAALLHRGRLVLNPDKGGVVVLDEAALELHRAPAGQGAQGAEAGDGPGDAGGAVGHGEVGPALVEAVDDVVRDGARDGELVVGGVCR